MSDILEKIVADKRAEVRRRRQTLSDARIQEQAAAAPPPRNFAAALQTATNTERLPVIAEIKHKSPSRGVLRTPFAPAAIAAQYAHAKAACLSVLTDEPYFGGSDAHLRQARAACELPVLRKDFMIDEWQIFESRALGADAILLLASVLSVQEMQAMAQIAAALGMTVLAEAHNQSEVSAALQVPDAVIGVNNRNLSTFEVSLQTTISLAAEVKAANRMLVSESGIATAENVTTLRAAGADAFLIGESLMRATNPGTQLQSLFPASSMSR